MSWYDPTSWDWQGAGHAVKNWLVGGDANKDMANGPASADYQNGYLRNMLEGNRAPVMNTGQSNEVRGQQGQLAGMLFDQARGNTPGAGELAVQRQANRAVAGNIGMANMARGADSAMAMRNAARSNADIGVNAAGQAGIAQLNDRTAAQSQLGGLLGTQRGQDIQVAGANQQAEMAQQQIQLAALAQMLGVDQATLQAQLNKQQVGAGDKGMLGSLLQIGGQIGAAYAGRPPSTPGT